MPNFHQNTASVPNPSWNYKEPEDTKPDRHEDDGYPFNIDGSINMDGNMMTPFI